MNGKGKCGAELLLLQIKIKYLLNVKPLETINEIKGENCYYRVNTDHVLHFTTVFAALLKTFLTIATVWL